MGQYFSLTLKFENVINLLLLCLSNLEYMTILQCSQKQSPSKCYSRRFFYYNIFLDSVFFLDSDQDQFSGTYGRMENTWLDFVGRVIQSSGWEGGAGREDLGWWGWEEEVLEGGAEMGLGRGWGLGGVVGCCEVRISLYQVRHYILSYLPSF